jgi:hypothetical protein
MRSDGVVTRRRTLFWGVSLAVLASATMASAQGKPPAEAPVAESGTALPPPPAAPPPSVAPGSVAPAPAGPQVAPMVPPAGYPPMVMFGPSRLPYVENDPVPPGYEIQTRPRMGLAKAGLATLLPLYGLSVIFGGVYLGSENGDAKKYGPMIIPVVGPFATIGTASTDEGTVVLLLDGLGQLTGAALFIAGMLSEEKYLARQTAVNALRPEVFVGPKSMAMRWHF